MTNGSKRPAWATARAEAKSKRTPMLIFNARRATRVRIKTEILFASCAIDVATIGYTRTRKKSFCFQRSENKRIIFRPEKHKKKVRKSILPMGNNLHKYLICACMQVKLNWLLLLPAPINSNKQTKWHFENVFHPKNSHREKKRWCKVTCGGAGLAVKFVAQFTFEVRLDIRVFVEEAYVKKK